jgi:hypothetical protein
MIYESVQSCGLQAIAADCGLNRAALAAHYTVYLRTMI